MELKSIIDELIVSQAAVLIVPLWNWNAEGAATGFTEAGFNRTFMELK